MKELVAREIAREVKDGDVLGIGTGSTVDLALVEIGKRIAQEKISVCGVTTSYQSAWRAEEMGIKALHAGFCGAINWGFDGADSVTEAGNAIKGKGGAMLKEKILAVRCKRYYLVVDETKLVKNLAGSAPIPVEVVPEAKSAVESALKKIGASEVLLRNALNKHGPVITEAGNIILDTKFNSIDEKLESKIKSLVGVVESGLFWGYANQVWIAGKEGVKKLDCRRAA